MDTAGSAQFLITLLMKNISPASVAPGSNPESSTISRRSFYQNAKTSETFLHHRQKLDLALNRPSFAPSPLTFPSLHTAFLFRPDFVSELFAPQPAAPHSPPSASPNFNSSPAL
jgi:hypothetical protein